MANTDKTIALVTGANKGIGLEIARQLAQAGMFVYLGARDRDRGEKAAATLASKGLQVSALPLDVTDSHSLAAAEKVIESEYGKLDVLVNNAGIAGSSGWDVKPSATSLDDIRTVFNTNFFGVIASTQTFLPLLRKSDAGRIVNVSSSLGSLAFTAIQTAGSRITCCFPITPRRRR